MKKISTIQKVRQFIIENNLILPGNIILLALSAGKDSMAMLNVLLTLRQEFDFTAAVFHLNHKMRSFESDKDEEFVNEAALKHNLKTFIFQHDFFKNPDKKYSFEEAARMKRYELINKVCNENHFHKAATAHNIDDNTETLIMRIFTGTGINGLMGIPALRNNIIRPLLNISTKEIYTFLNENKIKWREDQSNKDTHYTRNYVRHTVLPAVHKKFKVAGKSILTLSENAKEYDSIINELLVQKWGKLYTYRDSDIVIEYEKYISDRKIFKYILLKTISGELGIFLNKTILEDIYKKLLSGKNNILYKNRKFIIKKYFNDDNKIILISRNLPNITRHDNNKKIDWNYNFVLSVNNINNNEKSIAIEEINKIIFYSIVDFSFYFKQRDNNPQNCIFISLDSTIENASIRNRRDGDRIKLNFGTKKIKDLMINSKISFQDRKNIPLLIINNRIAAFMPGFILNSFNRISADSYITPESKKILAVRVQNI